MFDHFRQAHATVHGIEASDEEHLAVLELMLLVALADGLLAVDELDRIRDEVEGGEWETSTFNYRSSLGPAMAHVRAVATGDRPAEVRRLVGEIRSPALRQEAVAACRAVAGADGQVTGDEASLVAEVERLAGA
ncbi:MAG TPA: hypothetical protein VFJ85_04770 [Acidimicrobiales bacterium]|nr:hypothetical protein [Acidimicrobiales bacterium]